MKFCSWVFSSGGFFRVWYDWFVKLLVEEEKIESRVSVY